VAAVRLSDPGESAIELPWLRPAAASLVALARSSISAAWPAIKSDPGAVLHLVRHFPPGSSAFFPDDIEHSPLVLESALRHVQQNSPGIVDWLHPDVMPIHAAALAYARIAEMIALRVGRCDSACAWIGGLLAPLGWFAVCAIEPEAAADCLRHPDFADDAPEMQQELWGLDAHGLGRRLARRWAFPDWLRAVVGYLGLSAQDAAQVGADDRLFRIVQLAVLLAQTNSNYLGLPVGTECVELLNSLGLTEEDLNAIGAEWCISRTARSQRVIAKSEIAPALLPDLLELAIDKRRLEHGPHGQRLEGEMDRLQESLAEQRRTEAERLHRQKLRSLIELAAGAGHEINNPLAVISGQSQYLLRKEEDASRQDALRTIIRQTERIHQILTDLMQFARPPQPRRLHYELSALVSEVVDELQPFGATRFVKIEWLEPAEPTLVMVDGPMIRTALAALIRNAVEAASKEGWVRVSMESVDGKWQVAVEDNGAGPLPAQIEHLFDPFYSGHAAGRGRGLGLPTAWRLAQENGGDVRFEPLADSPARFIMSLPHFIPAVEMAAPVAPTAEYADRKIA
jgi:two-component system, NtrC family, sensor kinase